MISLNYLSNTNSDAAKRYPLFNTHKLLATGIESK